MPFEVKYDKDTACLMAKMTGTIDEQFVNDLIAAMIPILKKYKCTRILNDAREANTILSTINIYEIPKKISEAGFSPLTRRAMVVSEPVHDIIFYETVSKNQAQLVRIFTDYDDALKWVTAD